MKIRSSQIDEFERADSAHFPDKMFLHVQEAFPKHSAFLGDEGVREVVRYGIGEARNFGFKQQSAAGLFIDLTLLLGRFFHADLQMPWSADVLRDEDGQHEAVRAQRLHMAAMKYLDTVSGPDNDFIDAAQRRLLHESSQIQTDSAGAFMKEVSLRLERIWPEKYRQLTDEIRSELVREAAEKARGYGIDSQPGILICTVMMYMLGSGFDHDPLFSWAHNILVSTQDGPAKIKALHDASIAYLKQWCA